MNLFSTSENNSNASSLQENIASGIVTNLITKIGIDESMAKAATSFILPMVMEKITGKNSETPDDDASPITSLFGLAGGDSDAGIMGTLGKLF